MIIGLQPFQTMGDLDPDAILSPSRDVLSDETDLLLDRIAQLGQDWFNSDGNVVSQVLLASWDGFVRDVKAWDAGPRFITHLLGTTWRDELVRYQKTFNEYLQQFAAAGVIVTVPPFTFKAAPPGTLDRVGDKIGNAIDKATKPARDALTAVEIAAGVIGLAAVGYIFYLTFETGRTARAIAPRVMR